MAGPRWLGGGGTRRSSGRASDAPQLGVGWGCTLAEEGTRMAPWQESCAGTLCPHAILDDTGKKGQDFNKEKMPEDEVSTGSGRTEKRREE